jgi:hypothetical protein
MERVPRQGGAAEGHAGVEGSPLVRPRALGGLYYPTEGGADKMTDKVIIYGKAG